MNKISIDFLARHRPSYIKYIIANWPRYFWRGIFQIFLIINQIIALFSFYCNNNILKIGDYITNFSIIFENQEANDKMIKIVQAIE